MSAPVEVTVRGTASGGDGVADLPDGRVVFVPRTMEGDRVRIRLLKSRARWARGLVLKVLEPSPARVDAPCARYAECGGCQLQHVSYEDQLKLKGRFVADALERIGHFSDVAVPEVVASPKELGYRNRLSLTLRRLSGGYVVAGFHALGRPAHVVDIQDECLLPDRVIVDAWSAIRANWGKGADRLPTAGRLRLTVRLVGDAVDLIVEGGAAGWDAKPLHEAVGTLHAVWHVPGRTEDSDGVSPAVLAAGVPVHDSGPAFTQVNEEAAALLRAHVLERCMEGYSDPGALQAVDAYCGVGVYGRALADEGWTVRGIESDGRAVDRARELTAASRAANGSFDVEQGLVETALAGVLPADLLVLNPPRAGLHEDVPAQIIAQPPGRIIYVSCDPATLARDLARLTDAYELAELRAFDLFPQTAHVEIVAELRPRSVDE